MKLFIDIYIHLIIVHLKMYTTFANTLKNINQGKGGLPD